MSPRRVRILVIVAAAVAVLGIAAVVAWNVARDARTPLAAAQAYVDAIQAGDASIANTLVDPAGYSGHLGDSTGSGLRGDDGPADDTLVLDPSLLTDEVLAARVGLPDFGPVSLDYGADALPPIGESVEVSVEYSLERSTNRTTLLVEHTSDDWLGMPQWTVTTPLLVPLVVETNEIGAGPATLGADSPTPVAVSGPRVNGAPQHAALVYPGTYFIGGAETDYLVPATQRVDVGHATLVDVFDTDLGPAVSTQVYYSAGVRLVEELESLLPAYLERCTTVSPSDGDCPTAISARADSATDFAIEIEPSLDTVTSYQVEWIDGAPAEPSFRATWHTGRVGYTTEDGMRDDDTLRIYAAITIDGAEATIEFRPEL